MPEDDDVIDQLFGDLKGDATKTDYTKADIAVLQAKVAVLESQVYRLEQQEKETNKMLKQYIARMGR